MIQLQQLARNQRRERILFTKIYCEVKTLKSINVAIVAMEHYKCGYCGWLIEQHCDDYLQHHCFANKTKLGEPLQLMSDENNILTMYVPDDLAAAGASEAHGCMEETLISEVMTRRPLWDHSTSRAERHQAKLKDLWNEIFNIFEGKFDVEYLKKNGDNFEMSTCEQGRRRRLIFQVALGQMLIDLKQSSNFML